MVPHPRVRVLNNVGSTSINNNNNGLRGSRQVPRETNRNSYLKVLLLAAFFIVGLLINGDIHPLVKRGFFCSDSSILYPYKTDTVGIKTLMLLALVLPGLLISFCDKKLRLNSRKVVPPSVYDSARYKLNRRRVSGPQGEVTVEEEELMTHVKRRNYTIHEVREEEGCCDEEVEPMNVGQTLDGIPDDTISEEAHSGSDYSSDAEINLFSRIPLNDDLSLERRREYLAKSSPRINHQQTKKEATSFTARGFGEFQLFFFGLCCTIFITGLGKITGGRLRPHFIDKCQPNVDCLLPENAHRYIEEFVCQNLTLKEYPYITTSWPSGKYSKLSWTCYHNL